MIGQIWDRGLEKDSHVLLTTRDRCTQNIEGQLQEVDWLPETVVFL